MLSAVGPIGGLTQLQAAICQSLFEGFIARGRAADDDRVNLCGQLGLLGVSWATGTVEQQGPIVFEMGNMNCCSCRKDMVVTMLEPSHLR